MTSINHLWLLICACFVFFMQAGFVCYEVGFVQPKNVISVAMENITAFVVATLSFYTVGFALMFGKSLFGLVGTSYWLLFHLNSQYDYIFVLYQMMLAATSITIFAGSMSERTRMRSLVIASILVGGFIYPVFGHWVWGGIYISQPTFLSAMGYMDFAGATVVHSTAGWIALAGVIVVGPRKDRWDESGKPKRLGRSNIPFATLGTFILWFGWFGFNGGSALAANGVAAIAVANTFIAGATAMVAWLWVSSVYEKRASLSAALTGAIAGCAVVTPASGYVQPWAAMVIGLAAGLVCYGSVRLHAKLNLDDALDVWSVHGVGGVLGTLLAGVFAVKSINGVDGLIAGNAHQFLMELLAVVIVLVYSFAVTFGTLKVINLFVPVRVSKELEIRGLDISLHGEWAYGEPADAAEPSVAAAVAAAPNQENPPVISSKKLSGVHA